MVSFAFCPQNCGLLVRTYKAIHHSVNVEEVVVLLKGGGDI